MQQRPLLHTALKNNMRSAPAIAAIRACLRVILGAHKMLAARAAMPAFTKYADIVNKVCFFHNDNNGGILLKNANYRAAKIRLLQGTVKLEIQCYMCAIAWVTLDAMLKNILHFLKSKKITEKERFQKKAIAQSLLVSNRTITDIKDVEILKTFALDEELLKDIANMIKCGDIALLKDIPGSENLFEELTVIKFSDQNGQAYAAIIYDSYELWEEPMVVEVFLLHNNVGNDTADGKIRQV